MFRAIRFQVKNTRAAEVEDKEDSNLIKSLQKKVYG